MAISVVQHTHSASAGANNSVSLAFASSVTAGNLIVVGVMTEVGTTVTFSASDTLSNSYTNAVQQLGNAPSETIAIFYAPNIAGGSCTVTVSTTQTSTFPVIHIYEISGCATTSPLDQTGSSNNNAAPTYSVSTSAATTVADEYVFGMFGNGSVTSSTAPTPRTAIDGGTDAEVFNTGAFGSQSISLDYIVTTTGTKTATANFASANGGGTAAIATFKIASGTTVDKTHTVDALIIVSTDKTHTLDELIQVTTDKTHTLDTLVHVDPVDKTHTVDVDVQADISKTHTLDVVVNQDHDVTHTVGVLIHVDPVDKTHTVDADIKADVDKTHSLSVVIHEDNVDATHSLTAIILVDQNLSHSVTGDIQVDASLTQTVDALIVPYTIVASEVDWVEQVWTSPTIAQNVLDNLNPNVVFLFIMAVSTANNAVVGTPTGLGLTWILDKHDATVSYTSTTGGGGTNQNGGLFVWRASGHGTSGTVSVDTGLAGSAGSTLLVAFPNLDTTDGITNPFTGYARQRTENSGTGGAGSPANLTFSTGAVAPNYTLAMWGCQGTSITTFSAETGYDFLIGGAPRPRPLAVEFKAGIPPSGGITIHSNISDGLDQIVAFALELNVVKNLYHTVDLVLNNDKTLSHTVDADIKVDISKTHTIDVLVSQNVDKTHSVTADIQADISLTHTLDASIATLTTDKTHTIDCFVNAGVDITHTLDASLAPQHELSHTLDSFVQFLFNKVHTTDANISEANVDLSHRNDVFVGQFTDTDKTHSIDLFVAPAIYSFQPTRAERITAGQVITIVGNGFKTGCLVNFINDQNVSPTAVPGTSVTFVNAQTVTCVVPSPHDVFNELDRIEIVNTDGTIAILGAPIFTSGQQYRANRVADGTFSAGHPESFWQITHGTISGSSNNIVDITAPAIGSLRVTVQVVDICTFFPLNVSTKDTFFPVTPGEATFVLVTIAQVVNSTSGQWGVKFQYYDSNQFVLTTEKYIQGAPVTIPSNGTSGQTIQGYLDVAPSNASFVRIWGEITGHSANTVIDFDPVYWSIGLSYYADNTVTHAVSAFLEHAVDVTHTLDSIIKPDISITHTLDGLIQVDSTPTHTEDAFVVNQSDKTHTADAAIIADIDKTHTLTADVLVDEITNGTTDAIIAGIHDDTHVVDANITQDVNFAHTEDVFIVNQSDKTHTITADIQQDENLTNTVDVVVHQDNVDKTHSLDVSVLIPTNVSLNHSLDVVVSPTFDKTHSVDSFIQSLTSLNHLLDAIVSPAFDVTHSVDVSISLQNLAITVLDKGFDNSFNSFHATHSMSSTSDKLLLVAVATSNSPGQGLANVISVDGLNGTFTQIFILNNLSAWRYQPNLPSVSGQIAITLDGVSHVDWIVLEVQGANLAANDNGASAIRQIAEATSNVTNFNTLPLVESATVGFGSVQGSANLIAGTGYTTLVSQTNPDGVNAVTVAAQWKPGSAGTTVTQSWDNSAGGLMIAVEIVRNLVRSEISLESTVDAFIQNLANKTHSVDAVINQDHDLVSTADANISEANVDKAHSLDAIVQKDTNVTHTKNALIQIDSVLNQAVDANITQDVDLKHSLDVDINLLIDQFHTLTVMINQDVDRTHSLTLMVNQDEQVTSTIDALIQPTFDKNVPTDVIVHVDNVDKTQLVDSIVLYTQLLNHTIDAIVVLAATDHIHALDCIVIFPDQARSHSLDLLVNEQVTKNNIVDALIHADNLDRQHSLDAIVLSANTNLTHVVDVTVELLAENSAEFTCFFNTIGSFVSDLPQIENLSAEFSQVDSSEGYFTQIAEFPITNFTVTGNIEAEFIPVTLLVGSASEAVLSHTIDASLSATGNVSHGIDMVIATVENFYTGGFANISRLTRGFGWKV